jgi:ribokinase
MTKILNFGSLNIDYVYHVDHFVRPGETIHSRDLLLFCGGKGLNQSIALARAGAEVYHAGCVGEADGQMLIDALADANVNISNIQKTNIRSGNAVIQVNKEGENCIILFGGANQCVTAEHAEQVIEKFDSGDIMLLQNEISNVGLLIEKASAKGMTVVLNPSPCDEKIHALPLHLVDIFLVNEIEGKDIAGIGDADHQSVMANLRVKFPKAKIVLTLGKHGVMYFDGKSEYAHGTYNLPLVDTTAAGDTFTGYFLAGFARGETSPQMIEMASKAAGIAVSRAGASSSIPTISEVLSFVFPTVNIKRNR